MPYVSPSDRLSGLRHTRYTRNRLVYDQAQLSSGLGMISDIMER